MLDCFLKRAKANFFLPPPVLSLSCGTQKTFQLIHISHPFFSFHFLFFLGESGIAFFFFLGLIWIYGLCLSSKVLERVLLVLCLMYCDWSRCLIKKYVKFKKNEEIKLIIYFVLFGNLHLKQKF